MKKILIVTTEYFPKITGLGVYTKQLSEALPGELKVLLVPPTKSELPQIDASVKVEMAPLRSTLFFLPRWFAAYRAMRKMIKKYGINLICIQQIEELGIPAFWIKRFFKIPYIIFSHGIDIEYASRTRRRARKMRRIINLAEVVVANSQNLRDRIIKAVGLGIDQVVAMYPCPDISFFTAADQNEVDNIRIQYGLEGKKTILSVGQLVEGKGYRHLAHIMPKLLAEQPHLVWLIVGDGPQKKKIWAEIEKNNLQNIVRFVGNVPHKDLKNYYAAADLFVLLTHPLIGKEEGLGLAFLESAACGLPVVAGRSGGVDEGVIDGATGRIVDIFKGDESVAHAIADLLNDPEEARRLAQNARERLFKEFNWQVQLKKIIKYLS
ncbi:MAG TPA: glycosyltransferase family 4 protein [Candidatus Magasanikbacteria bacterium]|nr:glycosyltransferase family 4 protein [Candidatus Magasanikbacteria bacterium]